MDKFRLRYSYDAQLSLPTVNFIPTMAHEVSLVFTIDSEKKIKPRIIKCPKF
jgi:hypothetical protein